MIGLLGLFSNINLRRLQKSDVQNVGFPHVGGDFRPHYRNAILPKIKAYEVRRIAAVKLLRRNILIASVIGLVVAFFLVSPVLSYGALAFGPDMIFLGVATIVGLSWWARGPVRKYQASVKDEIYPLIFSFFGPDYVYRREAPRQVDNSLQRVLLECGINSPFMTKLVDFLQKNGAGGGSRLPDLDKSGIMPTYTNAHMGDAVAGTHRGVGIELREAKLTHTTESDKSRSTKTVFEGLFVTLTANKRFQGRTIIRRDLGLFNWAQGGQKGQQRVKLEDPVFEKKFEVFSDNQVEARYLLTTSFMERLLKLVALFESQGIEASFYDQKLLLMIRTKKDYFCPSSIFIPATFVEDIGTVLEEMKTIFEIIEVLKLDEKTGL